MLPDQNQRSRGEEHFSPLVESSTYSTAETQDDDTLDGMQKDREEKQVILQEMRNFQMDIENKFEEDILRLQLEMQNRFEEDRLRLLLRLQLENETTTSARFENQIETERKLKEYEAVAIETDKINRKLRAEIDEREKKKLDKDIFSIMMTSTVKSMPWILAIVTFIIQTVGMILILIVQTKQDAPYNVDSSARAGQIFTIGLTLSTQPDFFNAIQYLREFWNPVPEAGEQGKSLLKKETSDKSTQKGTRPGWHILLVDDYESFMTTVANLEFSLSTIKQEWFMRAVLPNILKMIHGLISIVTSVFVIIQSGGIDDLLEGTAILYVVSKVGAFIFYAAEQKYLGENLKYCADNVVKVTLKSEEDDEKDDSPIKKVMRNPSKLASVGSFAGMAAAVAVTAEDQASGGAFSRAYPNCLIDANEIKKIGDGKCDGGLLNTFGCGFDGGDCTSFNLALPHCDAPVDAFIIGNGECDEMYNTQECLFDGGDCCPFDKNGTLEFDNGFCNGGLYNTKRCDYDGGDCVNAFNSNYPFCPIEELAYHADPSKSIILGDGICDSGIYMTEECGYEGEDCAECNTLIPSGTQNLIGNGLCNGGPYLKEECGFDGGDCDECLTWVPNGSIDLIGDGFCDGGLLMSLMSCNMDGGDCEECARIIPRGTENLIGNGICNGGILATEFCSFDGGDCTECIEAVTAGSGDKNLIGDGTCNGGLYLSEMCSFDGLDCEDFIRDFPNCPIEDLKNVAASKRVILNDGICDGGIYMTADCGYEWNDCNECASKIPNGTAALIGNGICNGGIFMSDPACNYDGGDCLECSQMIPNSTYELLGNGVCNGGMHMVDECSNDGEDCSDFVAEFPFCPIEKLASSVDILKPIVIGDSVCDSGVYMSSLCGFEGGDCKECAEQIPEGTSDFIGNGVCNGGAHMSSPGCNLDGGDCLACVEVIPDGTTTLVGNGICNGGIYMMADECNSDGGDCTECAKIIPSDTESLIGDGFCNGGAYIRSACSSDGGDCDSFVQEFPNCPIEELAANVADSKTIIIGDGLCNSGVYMTEECGYEGNDCEECFNLIPSGTEHLVGDGFCNGGLYASIACNRDGGDCSSTVNSPPPPPGVETEVVIVADVNGDGHNDLIVGNRLQPNRLLINTGLGGSAQTTFHEAIDLPGGLMETYALVAADVNNDGHVDVIIGNWEPDQPNQLLINSGPNGNSNGGFFETPVDLPGSDMNTRSIATKDVNGDGYLDLIVGNWGEGQPNQLIMNNAGIGDGNNYFGDVIDLPGGTEETRTIAVVDVNNDGHFDLIFGNLYSANQLLLNTGISTGNGVPAFGEPIDLPGGAMTTYSIAAADFDNDGYVDLILGNFGQPNQLLMNSGSVIGDGPNFDTVLPLPTGGISLTYAVAAGDVNSDGFVDLIIGNWNQSNQLFENGGTTGADGVPVVRSVTNLPGTSDTNIVSIAVADLNNDGHPDIIFGNVDQQNQLLINLGDGLAYTEPSGIGSSWLPE